jgi:hypothetical protein
VALTIKDLKALDVKYGIIQAALHAYGINLHQACKTITLKN